MGNCQATTAAAVEVEHSDGRKERFYWPVSARQLMLQNPGHYVAVFSQQLPGCTVYGSQSYLLGASDAGTGSHAGSRSKSRTKEEQSRTKLKLMPPDAVLLVGSSYRLVTFEEAVQVSRGKRSSSTHTKHKVHPDVSVAEEPAPDSPRGQEEELVQEDDEEEALMATVTMQTAFARSMGRQQWRPALQSIAEVGW